VRISVAALPASGEIRVVPADHGKQLSQERDDDESEFESFKAHEDLRVTRKE
jgi:hypothetical protein